MAKIKKTIIAHFLILSLFLLVGILLIAIEAPFQSVSYFASLFFLILLTWCCLSWYYTTGNYFDLYLMFLVGTILFNGGQLLVQAFYPIEDIILKGDSPLCGSFSDSVMVKTIVLVFIGVCFMHFGALIALYKTQISRSKRFRTNFSAHAQRDRMPFALISPQTVRLTGYLLFYISIIPAILWQLSIVEIAREGGYRALLEVDTGYSSVVRNLKDFLIPGAMFLLAGSGKDRKARILSIIAITFYSITTIISGNRTMGIFPLVVYIWTWHILIREIPKIIFIGFVIFLLFIVMPFVQIVRLIPDYYNLDFNTLSEVFKEIENPFEYILMTMGNSMGAIAHTLNLVPDNQDFGLGITYARGFTRIIPNFFWDEHPGSVLMPDNWFQLSVSPRSVYGYIRGTGYSMIAESYYNFGFLGVPVVMYLWGTFLSFITNWAKNTVSPINIAVVASFSAFIGLIPRGFIASIFRPFVYYGFFPFIVAKTITNFSKRRIDRSPVQRY